VVLSWISPKHIKQVTPVFVKGFSVAFHLPQCFGSDHMKISLDSAGKG
jgi:hypothetical protein